MLFFNLFCYVSYIVSLLNMFARHTFVWIGCATGDRRSAVWRHATQRFKTRASSAPVPGLLAVQWWDCKDMNRGGIKLELVQSPLAYTCSYLNGRDRATGTLFLLNTLCDVSRLYEGSLPQAQTRTSISQTCLSDSLPKVDKLIVPEMLQTQMLEKIHETHLGIVRCKSRARRVLLWPGMSAQIEEIVAVCRVCEEHSRANPREPLVPMEFPDLPWALFELNNHHNLTMADCFSK